MLINCFPYDLTQGVNKKKKEESLGSPTLTNGRGGINHNVISSGTKRQRLASSSSVHSNPPACDPSKALRVNIKKMSSPEVQAALSAGSADETDAEEEDSARYVFCRYFFPAYTLMNWPLFLAKCQLHSV